MDENKFKFWQKWLTYANILTIGVGVIVAFFGNSIFLQVHNEYTVNTFFNGVQLTPEIVNFKNWLFGIAGGTIVGFHLLMVFISENAFKKRERWAYTAMWYGLLSWFVIDSSISIYYKAVYNVVLINLVALALIGLPLIFVRKAFNS